MWITDREHRYRLRARARGLNRLRWWSKAQNVLHYANPREVGLDVVIPYVLWSPEIGDFSFEIGNRSELIDFISETMRAEPARVRALVEEVDQDEQLRRDIRARRRPTLLPRNPPLGQRILWYVIARLRRPSLVIETGVWYGMGSTVLLRALERNAEEGHDGRLLSFDPDPTAGWLVSERHAERWTWVRATTEDALEANVRGRKVAMFVHDTPSTYEREYEEMAVAVAHAAPSAVLISNNGTNTTALPDLCRDLGLTYHLFRGVPVRHFYDASGVGLTVTP